jgi:hypothetical protein
MSETLRIGVEVTFNVAYLVAIWGLVAAMLRHRSRVRPGDRRVAGLVILAFGLLALGDTGHVGFRVVGYAIGDLEAQFTLWGAQVGLLGVGTLATANTVTFFYVVMLAIWRARYDRRYGPFEYLLLGAALVRLALLALPANEWNRVVPPQPMATIRNLPLMVLGLGVAYLMLRDAGAQGDRPFRWIGGLIVVSYACYLPVILFVQQVPLLGMLMIPKTVAYVGIAVVAYRALFRPAAEEPTSRRETAPALTD